jgi:hypothetical protein
LNENPAAPTNRKWGEAMPVDKASRAPPVGATLLALFASMLYLAYFAGLQDAGHSDAAGNAITDAFLALIGGALWIALAGLLLIAFKNGQMPIWAALGAFMLYPAAGYASFVSADLYVHQRGWAYIVPGLIPPVIVLYALWIRIPALVATVSETIVSALSGCAIVALIMASMWASYVDSLVAPARQEAQQAAYEATRAEQERVAAEDRARDEAKFAALGPASSLSDYLEYLNGSDSRALKAMEGARNARSRQSDAVALLRSRRRLTDMRELWQLNIEATPELCDAYRVALREAALKIDPSYSNRLSEAIELEFQLPNLKWLVRARCELKDVLAGLATRLRVVRDSSRIDDLADAMDALSR